jgi:hypothetical protein
MTNTAIQATLHMHGVTTMVKGETVLALDEYTIEGLAWSTWVDVTGWSKADLRNFLGYDNVEDQINYN